MRRMSALLLLLLLLLKLLLHTPSKYPHKIGKIAHSIY